MWQLFRETREERKLFMLNHLAGLIAICLASSGFAKSEILPNWASEAEKQATRQVVEIDQSQRSELIRKLPAGFRIPAEFESTEAVVMAYNAYPSYLNEIASHVIDAGAKVYMVGGPSRVSGLNPNFYQALPLGSNSVWVRDYGPMAINDKSGERILIDPIYRHYRTRQADDRLPKALASSLGQQVSELPIIMDGGNLMVDGQGRLFMTKRTYDWNQGRWSKDEVDQILKDVLGVKEVYALNYAKFGSNPADGTGHIDMFVKLVDTCKVMIAQTQDEPFKAVVEEAASLFAQLPCGTRGYEIFRVDGWYRSSTWYTYTNSLQVNDFIIMPGYAAGNDAKALRSYQAALPGAEVRVVNADAPIRVGGAVHCTTRELPFAG